MDWNENMRLDMTFWEDSDSQYIYGISITIDYDNQKYGWHSKVIDCTGGLISEELYGELFSDLINPPRSITVDKDFVESEINTISTDHFINKIIPDLNNLMIYTGAGMAVNAGVWDLAELRNKLYLNNPSYFLRATKYEKEKVRQTVIEFARQLYETQPTEAYFILSKLQRNFHITIATENRDLLHQKAGQTVITRDILKRFPLGLLHKRLVVIGLSNDHSGFINLYRNMNRKTPIYIVNNHEVPRYCSNNDFLIRSDLNQIFLRLNDKLL